MFVGNVHYITNCYNECKFQLLLEKHLDEKRKGSELSSELIEQCISAYLECTDSNSDSKTVLRMKNLLNDLGIKYVDNRSYGAESTIGNPEDAVEIFNQLASDLAKNKQKEK